MDGIFSYEQLQAAGFSGANEFMSPTGTPHFMGYLKKDKVIMQAELIAQGSYVIHRAYNCTSGRGYDEDYISNLFTDDKVKSLEELITFIECDGSFDLRKVA